MADQVNLTLAEYSDLLPHLLQCCDLLFAMLSSSILVFAGAHRCSGGG